MGFVSTTAHTVATWSSVSVDSTSSDSGTRTPSTFCVLFRHALILRGVDAPTSKRDVIACTRQVFAIDAAPFEKLIDVREGCLKARDIDPVLLLASYLKEIAQVIDAVDQIAK